MFKVGDKVKVTNPGNRRPIWDNYMSEIFPKYQKYWKYDSNTMLSERKIYELIGSTATCSLIQDGETKEVFIITTTALELVKKEQFTKSDLKDNHIVVYENGYKEIWCQNPNKNIVNENLSSSTPIFTDIVEVWEFDKLIWKREEILDEVEKKWLGDFIRPFKDRVRNIVKIDGGLGIFISIRIKGESSIILPYLKNKNMYKGMEVVKEYSLEDLGL